MSECIEWHLSRLVAPLAVRLALGCAAHVLGVRDGLEVVGVDARAVVAA
jgi:hypothetical protein